MMSAVDWLTVVRRRGPAVFTDHVGGGRGPVMYLKVVVITLGVLLDAERWERYH